ncbi:hypothetical protein [Bradyrhizobium septentrionale]|uniref:Uncharacterized protein n=1 Tax=Bradyrhizobium septentrionale TaxID=1404411 RepID=A0ABZ2P998_9BRAD
MKRDEIEGATNFFMEVDARAVALLWASARLFQMLRKKGLLTDDEIAATLDPDAFQALANTSEKQANVERYLPLIVESIRNLRDQTLGQNPQRH